MPTKAVIVSSHEASKVSGSCGSEHSQLCYLKSHDSEPLKRTLLSTQRMDSVNNDSLWCNLLVSVSGEEELARGDADIARWESARNK